MKHLHFFFEKHKERATRKYRKQQVASSKRSKSVKFDNVSVFLSKRFGQVDKNSEICSVIQHYHTQTQQITPTSS